MTLAEDWNHAMTQNTFHKRCIVAVATILLCTAVSDLHAQAGLRKSLERMDLDEDGLIDPDEITPLARPYLERIMRFRRGRERNVTFDKPIPISRIQEYARIYYALQNGVAGGEVRAKGEDSVKPFGTDRDEPLVPEFGIGEIKFPYTRDDLRQAERTISREDNNGDGQIDRAEAARAEWTHRNPFDDDLNKDGRLSRLELAQRYARRRLLQNDASELVRKSSRVGSEVKPSYREREDDNERRRRDWRRRGSSDTWLSVTMLSRFDQDKDGSLNAKELEVLGIPMVNLDVDRDSLVSRDELQAYVNELQQAASDQTEGLPGWFYERDANRDDQIAMAEYTDDWTADSLKAFKDYDLNGDGILTSGEVLRSASAIGGTFVNDDAMVLPPRKTIISEIEVDENFAIADLKVQISITHTSVSLLDGFLTGPDGQRIELFAGVGGSDDHFDQTVFDDAAEARITKSRPPFKGSFRPQALDKKQPGLASFKGKNIKGVWQLVIRGTRNTRFGMLHSWSIIVKPDEDIVVEDDSTETANAKNEKPGDAKPTSEKQNTNKPISEKSGEKDPITGLIELFK